jgi:hypothetical protein
LRQFHAVFGKRNVLLAYPKFGQAPQSKFDNRIQIGKNGHIPDFVVVGRNNFKRLTGTQ